MEFKELIVAFGAKYGIEGLDGADGVAELDVGGTRVEVLEDMQANSLLIYAEIGNPPPDANGVFGAMMLQANFLFRGTNGATLCQNPETHTYALVRMLPLALTGVEAFADAMESLVNQAENWRKVLEGLHTAEDVHKKTAESKRQELDDDHHGMLASGYFHV